MNLLQAGVDISTIAIWLGHENIETTHKYMVADIEIKRQAMEKLDETTNSSFNYKPSKSILAFLASLLNVFCLLASVALSICSLSVFNSRNPE